MAFPAEIQIPDRKGGTWRVRHCMHPTALWPYYLNDPQGTMVIAPNGLGFQTQLKALTAALLLASGRGHLYHCPNGKVVFGWKDIYRGLKLLAEHEHEAVTFLHQQRTKKHETRRATQTHRLQEDSALPPR